MRLSYAEQNFILAEGAVRGWISGDASTYYKKGIEASMNFIADNTPDKEEYTHGRTITQEYIQEYLAQPVIQLSGDKEKDLEMILLQRYLASFLQHPYDAYYDYRRTGYPVLPINPNTNLNTEKDKIDLLHSIHSIGMFTDVACTLATRHGRLRQIHQGRFFFVDNGYGRRCCHSYPVRIYQRYSRSTKCLLDLPPLLPLYPLLWNGGV